MYLKGSPPPRSRSALGCSKDEDRRPDCETAAPEDEPRSTAPRDGEAAEPWLRPASKSVASPRQPSTCRTQGVKACFSYVTSQLFNTFSRLFRHVPVACRAALRANAHVRAPAMNKGQSKATSHGRMSRSFSPNVIARTPHGRPHGTRRRGRKFWTRPQMNANTMLKGFRPV